MIQLRRVVGDEEVGDEKVGDEEVGDAMRRSLKNVQMVNWLVDALFHLEKCSVVTHH